MHSIDLGHIKMIPGEKGGRFPFCNSLFIDDSIQVIIDPGAGLERLQRINREYHIEYVFNTHVHFDHIAFNHVFDEAKILVNKQESLFFNDRREFLKATGVQEILGEEWVTDWLERIKQPDSPQSLITPAYRHEWHLSLARLDGTYMWGESFDFGHTKMKVVAAPGHSPGFSVMFFPEEGIVYCGDIDLTKFGPWCQDSWKFIESARRVAEIDADLFITGHERGILTRTEFTSGLDEYLAILTKRDHHLLKHLKQPLLFSEIANMGLFYGPRIFEDKWLYCWEWTMLKEHLKRLIDQDLVLLADGKYRRI
ncbi:MAG: MBL fold metallo-hydrolase [Ignavibacteriales bacterium]